MSDIRPDEVSAIIREQLSNFKSESELQETGTILQVGDGVARIYGLSNAQSGELLQFENGINVMDKDLKIKWPRKKFFLSKKDKNLMTFEEFCNSQKFL